MELAFKSHVFDNNTLIVKGIDKNKHSALVDFETNMSCFEVNLCIELGSGVMVAHPQEARKDLSYRLRVLRLKTLLCRFGLRVRHS